jgi:hypothetical protein
VHLGALGHLGDTVSFGAPRATLISGQLRAHSQLGAPRGTLNLGPLGDTVSLGAFRGVVILGHLRGSQFGTPRGHNQLWAPSGTQLTWGEPGERSRILEVMLF